MLFSRKLIFKETLTSNDCFKHDAFDFQQGLLSSLFVLYETFQE